MQPARLSLINENGAHRGAVILALCVLIGAFAFLFALVSSEIDARFQFMSKCVAYQTEARCELLYRYKRQDLIQSHDPKGGGGHVGSESRNYE
jgi:hypothetical protein